MSKEIYNSKNTKHFRRNLRQQEVSCERLLWSHLRNNAILNLKFRRQYSIGDYIVDFYCSKIKLVLEIDGATHGTNEEILKDNVRQTYIESLGIKVKRYTNTDVKENLDCVLGDILDACEKLLNKD